MEKRCTKCQQVKSLTEFHRYKQSKDGHKARCKSCNCEESTQWRIKNPERAAARNKAWVEKNRDKARAASRQWNARNRGVPHARQVELHGREVVNERSRRWAATNREKARAWKAQWKKNNPNAVAAMSGKRRAMLRHAIPLWANGSLITQIYRQCRDKPGYHVDHIVPLVSPLVCGLHCEANLQVIPASENYSKNNRRWPDMP